MHALKRRWTWRPAVRLAACLTAFAIVVFAVAGTP